MLGKLLFQSTQATLALVVVALTAALVLPHTDGGLWVFTQLANATLLALAGTLAAGGVWAVDRIADRAVASLRGR